MFKKVFVLVVSSVLTFLISATATAATASFLPLPQEVIEKHLQMNPVTDQARYQAMKDLFERVGCKGDLLQEQPVPGREQPNIICTLKGSTSEAPAIVVGARYDRIGKGSAAVENWSGVVLLPLIYQSLLPGDRQHPMIFVAFSGSKGAGTYINKMDKNLRKTIRNMVSISSVGMGPASIWIQSDGTQMQSEYERLLAMMQVAKQATQLPVDQKTFNPVTSLASDETAPFRALNIPAGTVHSVDFHTEGIPGSSKDQLTVIKTDDYYNTYRLVSVYLLALDHGDYQAGSEQSSWQKTAKQTGVTGWTGYQPPPPPPPKSH